MIPEIGKKDIIASATLFKTIDHEASASYCKAIKNTANTEIPKKKYVLNSKLGHFLNERQ